MVWVDTNVLYLLSGVDCGSRIDFDRLEDYISNKDIVIYDITLFEILNNSHHCFDYPFIINSVIAKAKSVNFATSSFLAKNYDPINLVDLANVGNDFRKYLPEVRKTISKPIVEVFTFYYSNLLACGLSSYFVLFANFEDSSISDPNFFQRGIQNHFDLLEPKIRSYLQTKFSEMILDFEFCEKKRKALVERLFTHLVEYYADAYNATFQDLDVGVFRCEKLFMRLERLAQSVNIDELVRKTNIVPFESVSLFNSVSGQSSLDKMDSIKNYLIRVAAALSRGTFGNGYLRTLFFQNLQDLLLEKSKFNDNDILDALLLDAPLSLYSKGEIDAAIIFDKKFSKRVEKFIHGLKILTVESFKT